MVETGDKPPLLKRERNSGKSLFLDGGRHMRSKLHAFYGVWIVQR